MQKLTLLLVMSLLMTGCLHSTQIRKDIQVEVAAQVVLGLLSPADFGESLVFSQVAEIQYADETHHLMFQTEINAHKIVMVGLTTSGTRLFNITYDGGSVEVEGADFIINKIQPLYLLADLQLALWPMDKLQASLKKESNCFSTHQCSFNESTSGLRSLSVFNETQISIEYAGVPHLLHELNFRHHQRGYQLKISPLSIEEL